LEFIRFGGLQVLQAAADMAKKAGKPVTEMADDEVHVPLQAVLLADSFTQKFRPITLEKPKVRVTFFELWEMVDKFGNGE